MVHIISVDLRAHFPRLQDIDPLLQGKQTPGRKYYKLIADAIFEEWAVCFRDEISGKPIGDGKFSLWDQIETCMENKHRLKSAGQPWKKPVQGNRQAACVIPEKFCPPLNTFQKMEAENTRRELLQLYKNDKSWDWDKVREKLTTYSSFAAQRHLITMQKRNINDAIEKWPFLCEVTGMLIHMRELCGCDLQKSYENFTKYHLTTLIEFMTLQSPKRINNTKLQTEIPALDDGIYIKFIMAVVMIANHFEEDSTLLIRTLEVI